MERIEVMSTRLFPKNEGADAYVLNGIAGRCDWVVSSDMETPRAVLVERVATDSPRHVFLSLRSPFEALAFFVDEVLPRIKRPFVLVSGSEDVTVPNQLDIRWRRFDATESASIQALLADPRLLHWYAENLDARSHPKFSPIPLGMVFFKSPDETLVRVPEIPPLASRPLRVLCGHRVREDAQWELRRAVTALCRREWAEFCTVLDGEVSEAEYVQLLQQHAFVLCVEGGGLDPSPKAWQAVLHGSIPIVRSSALDAAYGRLPVAFVTGWDAAALSPEKLRRWRSQHAPAHDDPAQRAVVLHRLGIDEWWSKIETRQAITQGL